jgi:hypothetical protein
MGGAAMFAGAGEDSLSLPPPLLAGGITPEIAAAAAAMAEPSTNELLAANANLLALTGALLQVTGRAMWSMWYWEEVGVDREKSYSSIVLQGSGHAGWVRELQALICCTGM